MHHPAARFRAYFPLALALLAAGDYFWLAPLLEKLPRDYVAETKIAAKCVSRQAPSAPVEEYESIVRRHDQTLFSDATHSIIQGDEHWVTPAGVPIFEVLSLYGVDRRTRENLPAYGSEARTGQYLFPPNTRMKTYGHWDPMYAGPRVANYDHSEERNGLLLYVFIFIADGIDETSGFSALPDVPERYRATTYGQGKLWLEPLSGIVVDYEDEGRSYFVEKQTGKSVAEIFHWKDRYTTDTRTKQIQLARQERFRRIFLDRGIPGGLLASGLLFLAIPPLLRRRRALEVVACKSA